MEAIAVFYPVHVSCLPKLTQLVTVVSSCSSDPDARGNVTFVKNPGKEAAETAQNLRIVAALPETQVRFPASTWQITKGCNCSPRGSDALSSL